MKNFIALIILTIMSGTIVAQDLEKVILNPPDLTKGLPVMEALSQRASASEFDDTMLSRRDLSDLVWAANGINRPEKGKRTAPSAYNSQDVDVYVIMKSGAYVYDAGKHILEPVAQGDHRAAVAGAQEDFANAAVFCVFVSDISRFQYGDDDQKMVWAAEDAAIVSQNVSVFCAATGLLTRPRASMDREKLTEVLNLNGSQHMMLNNPVSYKK